MRTLAALGSQLFRFHAHVSKLSKVLIKGGDWHVLGHGCGGDQTVDKVSLRSLIAFQPVEVDRDLTDLDARTGNQSSECGGNIGSWMPVKRLKHEYTLCQHDRQYHNDHLAPITGVEELPSRSGMSFMVLYQIANNEISVDKSLPAHRVPA